MNFRLVTGLWHRVCRDFWDKRGLSNLVRTREMPNPSPGSGPWKRGVAFLALVGMVLMAFSLNACRGAGGGNGLLAGKSPTASSGVQQLAVLNDGEMSRPGDHWNTELTAIFSSTDAYVVYDLGQTTPIKAGFLEGDDNDEYIVSVSDDQQTWKELWVAGAASGKGQQGRQADNLTGQGRYVKISARGGDRSYSLAEIQLFSEKPAVFPPAIPFRSGLPGPEGLRTRILLFGLSLAAWLALTSRRNGWYVNLALAGIPLVAAYFLMRSLQLNWPAEQREVSLVRGVSAGIAAMAVLRELLGGKVWPAAKGVILSVLSVAAIAGVAGFFNLGHPQFWDAKERQPLFVHNFDMRVYYPIAKYFDELRFDGLYQASVAAYAADDPSTSVESLRHVEFRDLKDHRMRTVAEQEAQIRDIPKRFTPERWETFKVDMRYFRETMGVRDYLGSMRDHGGNATPVWFAVAHLIFGHTVASNNVLFMGSLIDPLLLALAVAAIWRAYGVRTALLSAVIFGANDFYMFGSNWAGATMRHDWMAYLAFGLCAIRLRWWRTGGAFLALSALIRAFPALALAWVAIPGLWWIYDHKRARGRYPTAKEVWQTQQPIIRILIGAGACIAALFLFSSLMFSFDAWLEWLAKVRLLDRDPHVNHVSLRALVAGSTHLHHDILRARTPLFVAAAITIAGLLSLLSRGRPLDQAAALGSLMIPIMFNPANYYIHFIYVLPVLAHELVRRKQSSAVKTQDSEPVAEPTETEESCAPAVQPLDAGVWLVLAGICVAEYWTVLESDVELHFQYATVLLFAGMGGLLAVLLKRDWPIIAGASAAVLERFEAYSAMPELAAAGIPAGTSASAPDSDRPSEPSAESKRPEEEEPASSQAKAEPSSNKDSDDPPDSEGDKSE